ncbi:MAG TPA: hypothetical protein VEC56_02975 [Candidatus Krumholzibacteria bacterium]|nr:hypothetical protein [Candidatus Krumholzibacteria bacterium]
MTRIVVTGIVLTLFAASAAAQEARRSSWGFYAAPTSHHVSSGTDLETMESSTSLDWGLFYARTFTRAMVRIEARYASREFYGSYTSALFPTGFPVQPMREDFLELPIVLHGTNTVSLNDATIRISIGGGLYYALLISQEFLGGPSSLPDAPEELGAGDYSRYGWLGDGGVALIMKERNAVFLHFRMQSDLGVTGEPEQSIAREDAAFGFYAGFEWLF